MMEPPPTKEAALAPVSVFWDIKWCPVPDDYDARRVGPCIKWILRKLGYTGPITITAVGLLSEVPRDVLEAIYSTGISLKQTFKSPTNMFGLFLDSFLRKSPPPSNMMVISRQPACIPAEFSHFLNRQREKGYYIIFPFPLEEMPSIHATPLAKSLWKQFLLEDPVALEEDKCTETGEPPSWFCNVCHRFVAPGLADGRGIDNFLRHLSTGDHARQVHIRITPKSVCEQAVEVRVEAPLDSYPENATTIVSEEATRGL